MCCGPSTWAASVSTCGPTGPTTPTTPTSSASTSTRSPGRRSTRSARRPATCAPCWRSSGWPAIPRRPATVASTSTSGSSRAGTASRSAPAAVALARELERRHPDLITANWWKEERGERIFVDFNQNAPHKTVFGAWFARPRVGGQVSTPLAWDEIDTVDPEALTIRTVPDRLRPSGRPLGGHGRRPQSLATPAGHGRAGPGRRAARRAVASRVPQAARRAAAGGPEPGQKGMRRMEPTDRPAPDRLPARTGRGRDLQGAGLPQRRRGHRRRSGRRAGSDGIGPVCRRSPGSGKTSAQVITEAAGGGTPAYLEKLEAVDPPALSAEAAGVAATDSRATATATRTGPTAAAPSTRWPGRPGTSGTDTGR